MNKIILISVILLIHSTAALAWDGLEEKSGHNVELVDGTNLYEGAQIQYYDAKTHKTYDLVIDTVDKHGSVTEIDGYNGTLGKYVVLDMI